MNNSAPLGTGSLVGERFIFEEQIGRGGMGTVFKARDLRREELQIADSQVAIKILNEEFKRHPNAVQALQREARKAQTLAHPNIVTVYDFDRDGSEVYMTMELLQGQSLDRVIKEAEGVGVGFGEAFRIIHAVCEAMAYAHARGIVHADFKPANVFITNTGVVKVLDFGIAQAVKRTDLGEGSQTLFDPGDLGALTPAYAGYEVIEGQEPDVRDDIYAIACVFYELLTGKHPYGRLSAEDASKSNVVPERPRALSRGQLKMLRSALEFRREPRPSSALTFVEGLRPKRKVAAWYFGLAAAASVAIVVMISSMHWMNNHDSAVSAALVSNDAAKIESVMPWLKELQPERRASIFLDSAARAGLVQYFTRRVDDAVDPSRERYNYAQADALIKELWELLPDSQTVKGLVDRVGARREYALQRDNFQPSLIEMVATDALAPDENLKLFDSWLKTAAPPRKRGDYSRSLNREMSAAANTAALLSALPPTPAVLPTEVPPAAAEVLQAKQAPVPAAAATPPLVNGSSSSARASQAAVQADLRLASAAAQKGRLEDALSLAESAIKAAPRSPIPTNRELAVIRKVNAARDRYAEYVEIDEYLRNRSRILTPHIRYKIWRLSKVAPEEIPAVRERLERDLNARIRATSDPKLAAHLTQASQAIFGTEIDAHQPMEQVAADVSAKE